MAIVTFYNGDPKDAPKTTMPARLGANAIITCKNRLLLEKRSDSDVWGLVGGGCKKWENGRQAIAREVYEELGLRIAPERFRKLAVYDNPGRIASKFSRIDIACASLSLSYLSRVRPLEAGAAVFIG